jgi:hypothetical protein
MMIQDLCLCPSQRVIIFLVCNSRLSSSAFVVVPSAIHLSADVDAAHFDDLWILSWNAATTLSTKWLQTSIKELLMLTKQWST